MKREGKKKGGDGDKGMEHIKCTEAYNDAQESRKILDRMGRGLRCPSRGPKVLVRDSRGEESSVGEGGKRIRQLSL